MKTNRLAMAMTVAIASASCQALAHEADTVYLGLGYGHGIYSADNVPDFTVGAAIGRLGAFGSKNLAIEGRAGVGVLDDTQSVNGVDVTLELDTLYGMYGLGHFTFGKNSSIYGVLGFTKVRGNASAAGVESGGEGDISYGVGVDLGITRSIAINIEYMSYVSTSSFDINAAGLGLVIGF